MVASSRKRIAVAMSRAWCPVNAYQYEKSWCHGNGDPSRGRFRFSLQV